MFINNKYSVGCKEKISMYPAFYLQNTIHTLAIINYAYIFLILHLPGVNGGSYKVDSHGKDIRRYEE